MGNEKKAYVFYYSALFKYFPNVSPIFCVQLIFIWHASACPARLCWTGQTTPKTLGYCSTPALPIYFYGLWRNGSTEINLKARAAYRHPNGHTCAYLSYHFRLLFSCFVLFFSIFFFFLPPDVKRKCKDCCLLVHGRKNSQNKRGRARERRCGQRFSFFFFPSRRQR